MKSLNSPIIKFTLVLLAGVITGFYTEPTVTLAFVLLGSIFLIFLVEYFRSRKKLFQDAFLGILVWILFFFLGIFTAVIHLPQNQKSHYLQKISSEVSSENNPVLQVRIKEALKPDLFNNKSVAEVEAVDNSPSHGKILVLSPKDSLKSPLKVGERLLMVTEIKKIPSPLNPHQFDYSRFMGIRGVQGQVNLQSGKYVQIKPAHDLFSKAASLRETISEDLRSNGFQPAELAIVQALLLGQKQDISTETYNNYAAAGAIHILAVSGLHVGIILLLLNYLFSPLDMFKKGKILKIFLIILILWGFAVLAGLSPSVVRAVTMFSFLAIGIQLNRRSSSVNSLFLSLLLLVLIRPQWIFEVGFQLSYAAVLAIFLIQPLLYNLILPQNTFFKYLWGILTTTIAAQAGVLPLSLFYFHQFPGLFFLSNLLILPFLGLILGTGILVIILASLDLLPGILTSVFSGIIRLLNSFVAEIAKQEKFLFSDIPFSIDQVLIFYSLLLFLLLLVYSFSFRKLMILLISVILIQATAIFKIAASSGESLLILHRTKNTIIAKQEQERLTIFHNSDDINNLPMIKNYRVGAGISEVKILPPRNVYKIQEDYLLLIDSTAIYTQKLKPKYLLLSGSPKINLERIIEQLDPQIILTDGSNYRSLINRWKLTAAKKELPFHHTGEKGAFVMP